MIAPSTGSVKPAAAARPPAETELQSALMELRVQTGRILKVSATVVFSNVALAGIVRRLPRSLDALLQLQGIGKLTAQRHGAAIIALVEAHCAKHGILASSPSNLEMESGDDRASKRARKGM
jgi:superfamily II DNA helicase RecQ